MEALITIFLACRAGETSNLKEFLSSLCNASTPDNYEILIKFDDDDPSLASLLDIVEKAKEHGREKISPDTGESEGFFPGQNIRYIVTPRGLGYGDLHKAYIDLLRIADPKTEMYWTLSDDVILLGRNWDLYLKESAKAFSDGLFVICPTSVVNYRGMSDQEALEICDNYPVWSAKLLHAMGFGYTFAMDAWTNMLMRKLFYVHGIDRRTGCQGIHLERRRGSQDFPGSERWNGIRKETHELLLSAQVQNLLDAQVGVIAGMCGK